MPDNPFRLEDFARVDESADENFYDTPRLVVHIDEPAIAAVGRLYADTLPASGDLLDLMSSWKSHLPAGFPVKRLVGLGMNEVELRENDQLDEWVVQNLNRDPSLPFADNTFDGCIITVSVQYLTRPIQTFGEVRRVLRPGAPLIVSFSNRCFPTKAVALWRDLDDAGHTRLVSTYFQLSGPWDGVRVLDCSPDLPFYSDPVFAVLGSKPAGESPRDAERAG